MKRYYLMFVCCLIAMTELAQADIVLIANKSLALETISHIEISEFYMGRKRYFDNGEKVIPLDQQNELIKKEFYQRIVGKPINEINAYWARLLFSGRATPPLSVTSSEEVISIVKKNPSAIGYINEVDLTPDVKVIGYVD